ncbi:MAG: hypothetical protein JWP07_183, partial [Pseudonocardiales bacterium]|nr:hypothetical protein [Pseudonocardiales bacterium]
MGFRLRSDEGFLIEEHPEGRTLVVTGDWSDRAAKVLRSGKADGLTLNYARGYRERSLDFLQEWPLRGLWCWRGPSRTSSPSTGWR